MQQTDLISYTLERDFDLSASSSILNYLVKRIMDANYCNTELIVI